MKKIKFLGAAGEVTGSGYLLTSDDDKQLLIDFGMFQGSGDLDNRNYIPLDFNPGALQAILLTHAHLDHCGRLPQLVAHGYRGSIYMTAPTKALMEVVLNDSAKIALENLDHQPLYTADDVQKTLSLVEVVEYDSPVSVGNFTITFKDAGHILGSSSIVLSENGKTIVFSGDLGNSPEDIVKPTEYIDNADFVVMETTYGDKAHPQEDATQILQTEIQAIEHAAGVLLIPAFSLERTQELLHRINHLKKDGKIKADTPVFLDSPMGIRATEIFREFREFYNHELQSHTDDPFGFEGLAITEQSKDSKEIIRAMDPKVIIAGSGMMNGGRILHHALNYLGQKNTRILFVGYQAEETLGRKILNGQKNIWIYKTHLRLRAHISNLASMSSHADQPKLLTWLKHIQGVQKVFLIHGETKQRQSFLQAIRKNSDLRSIFLPQNGEEQVL